MASPLDINELLYEILSYLPEQDSVAAYAVCRTWQDVIWADIRLQAQYRFAQWALGIMMVGSELRTGRDWYHEGDWRVCVYFITGGYGTTRRIWIVGQRWSVLVAGQD